MEYIRINLNLNDQMKFGRKRHLLRSDDPTYKISFVCQIDRNSVNSSNWAIKYLTCDFDEITIEKKLILISNFVLFI